MQGEAAIAANGGDQQSSSNEAELARFHAIVDERVHGLTNWASRSKNALQENQGRIVDAVKENDKLIKKNLTEFKKALDRIVKLQGSDQKF